MSKPYSDLRVLKYLNKYNFNIKNKGRLFTTELLNQLERCKSEEARRLILGVSR